MRRRFAIPAESEYILSRLQVFGDAELVIRRDLREPLTRAEPLAQLLRWV